jgi:hypothetical protein
LACAKGAFTVHEKMARGATPIVQAGANAYTGSYGNIRKINALRM